MEKANENDRLRMVCAACSSEQVTRDAWAEWNIAAQDWQLSAVFDFAHCHRCQAITHVEARPLAGSAR